MPVYEVYYPADMRPREAINAARGWVNGKITVSEARMLALAAHAAARETVIPESIAAARATGHAAATAHVARHARHAAHYAIKASSEPNAEADWQKHHLQNHYGHNLWLLDALND